MLRPAEGFQVSFWTLPTFISSVSGSGGTAPTGVAGLTFWLDGTHAPSPILTAAAGSGGTTVSADGELVGYVVSRGTLSYAGVPTSASYKPAYKTEVVNGNSVLRFEGNTDNLSASVNNGNNAGADASFANLLGSTNYTCIFALSLNGDYLTQATNYANRLLFGDASQYGGVYVKSLDATQCLLLGYAYSSGDFALTLTVTKNEFCVVSLKHVGSSMHMRKNGGAWVSLTVSPVGSTAGRFGIGSPTGANMDLAHLALFNAALSDADITSVERYVGSAVGLTI